MKTFTLTLTIQSTIPSSPLVRLWLMDKLKLKELGRGASIDIGDITEKPLKRPKVLVQESPIRGSAGTESPSPLSIPYFKRCSHNIPFHIACKECGRGGC